MNPIAAIQVFVENFMASAAGVLPLGLSFGAGMVAAVNPCGFVLLPAYLGLFLRASETPGSRATPFLRAIGVSAAMTLGFVALFGTSGLLIALGLRAIIGVVPWIALAIGILLVVLGVAMLLGAKIYSSLATRIANAMPGPAGGPLSFFVFGITYAIASLSCTLPIFLLVVVTPLISGSVVRGAANFVNYALGMGLVVTLATLGIALFKGTAVKSVRRAGPTLERVSAALLVVAGAYLTYYWLAVGGLWEDLRAMIS